MSSPVVAQNNELPAPAVTVARAAQACFTDAVFFNGLVAPREEVVVAPAAEGARVTEFLVEEGASVRSGQVMARLSRASPDGRAGAQTIEVTAPADGLVLRRGGRVGAIVSAASPEPLFRIAARGEAEVEADIPEARMPKVAEGQTARVNIPGLEEVTGKVRAVAPEIDRQTRLGRAKISLPTDSRPRFGLTVSGVIEAGRSCGVSVPVSALVIQPEGTSVQKVQNGRVETRSVRVGLVEGTRAEIRDGLTEGDMVVARAGAFLRDGDAIRPIETPERSASEQHSENRR